MAPPAARSRKAAATTAAPASSEPTVANPDINSAHFKVDSAQPHVARRKAMRKAHPELEKFERPRPDTALWVFVVIAVQFGLAHYFQTNDFSWWAILGISYAFGAVACHAMWVLIHDLCHNNVFKSDVLTYSFHIIANTPLIAPSAITFMYYHREHHGHLNEAYADPDLPGPLENKLFGHSAFGKALWLLFFAAIQSVRTLRYRPRWGLLAKWNAANWIVQMSVNIAVWYYMGPKAFGYLGLSSAFAIGLHPLGARWIAEHYSTNPPQETYSYYGGFNAVSFNVGYHNEHHDLPQVPWMDLPNVKKTAPEFYDDLADHPSYWKLLFQFIFDSRFTLQTRVIRASKEKITLDYSTKGNEKVEHYEALLQQEGKAMKGQ